MKLRSGRLSSVSGVGTAMMKASAGSGVTDGAQLAGHHGGADQHVEVRLAEMNLALRDHGDRVLVDIDADHLDAPAGERGCGRQADIAEAEDRDAENLCCTGQLLDDLLGSMAVTIGIVGAARLGIGPLVVEQAVGGTDDAVDIGADKLDGAGFDRFGAFGHVAHHQHRLAERGASS